LSLVGVCIPWLSAKKSRFRATIVFGEIVDVQHKKLGFPNPAVRNAGFAGLEEQKKAAPKGGVFK